MKRALIVKLGAIGDVVMAVPAVHRLHALGYSIDWVAGRQAASVLGCYPFVRVIEADDAAILQGSLLARLRALGSFWARLGFQRYDLVATLYYDRRYRLFSLPVLGTQRIALDRSQRNLHPLPDRHHTDEFARILLAAAGHGSADSGPVPASLAPLPPTGLPNSPLPASPQPRVVLAAGGARNTLRDDALRRWPVDNYAALARMLVQAGMQVVLTGGPADEWVREAFADVPCTDLIGSLALPELLALFNGSDAVVTHDSGPLHLAGITRCALVGVFGPVDPWTRLPRRAGTAALWGGEGFACRPCYDGSRYAACGQNDCMAQVTPQMVFATLRTLLDRKESGTLPGPAVYLPPATRPAPLTRLDAA